jgi:hypothetical protein
VRREEVHERKMLVNEGGDPAVEAQQSSTLFFIRRKPRLRRYRLSTQRLAAPPAARGFRLSASREGMQCFYD